MSYRTDRHCTVVCHSALWTLLTTAGWITCVAEGS